MEKIYIFCFLLFGIGIMSCSMHNQKKTEVSFYLVNNKTKDDISKNDLSGVVLAESPIFTTKDIIEYSQSKHTIKLTKEAFEKFKAIRWGKVFAFCVDNKPVLLGAMWSLYYSVSFCSGLSAFEVFDGCNEIQLEYCILDGSIKEGIDDPRSNKLILDSLRKSNKLVETISEQKALEIAKKLFLEFNYGLIEQYKFTGKSGCESWSIFYTSTGKYNYLTNFGAIIVNKKTGETKHIPGIKH